MYKKIILIAVVILTLFSNLGQANTNEFSRLFIFGDSLSDIGNTSKLFGGTLPKSPPYYEGRFSNGPLWVENFSKELNFPSELVINYSFAGARVVKDFVPVPSLDQQIAKYIQWNPNGADPNALYALWIGSNDIINDEYKCNDFRVVAKISHEFKKQIRLLIKHGARTFLIPNLPAISVTPLASNRDALEHTSRYSSHIDQMTINYNQLLQYYLNILTYEYPEVNFIRFDSYELLRNAANYAGSFGITNIYQSCYLNLDIYNTFNVCDNPNEYLFWDAIHPSAIGHKVLSNFISKAVYDAGYSPMSSDYQVTDDDITILNKNTKAINELTNSRQAKDKFNTALLYPALL